MQCPLNTQNWYNSQANYICDVKHELSLSYIRVALDAGSFWRMFGLFLSFWFTLRNDIFKNNVTRQSNLHNKRTIPLVPLAALSIHHKELSRYTHNYTNGREIAIFHVVLGKYYLKFTRQVYIKICLYINMRIFKYTYIVYSYIIMYTYMTSYQKV